VGKPATGGVRNFGRAIEEKFKGSKYAKKKKKNIGKASRKGGKGKVNTKQGERPFGYTNR